MVVTIININKGRIKGPTMWVHYQNCRLITRKILVGYLRYKNLCIA